MEAQGFKVTRHAYGIKTAFVAEYESPATAAAATRGETIRTVGFCSEYDALPGVGHACGHNLIAIAGLAAAIGVKAALEKHNLVGRLRIIGTPAEVRSWFMSYDRIHKKVDCSTKQIVLNLPMLPIFLFFLFLLGNDWRQDSID